MIYKYRLRISVFLFVFAIIAANILLGGPFCSDGWSSSSIGSRGACSHHGGVSSTLGVISFVSAILAVVLFNSHVNKKYRTHKGFVALNKLPPHPLENINHTAPNFIQYKVPALSSKSRKDFSCSMCSKSFKSGEIYFYVVQKTRDKKHCESCTKSIPALNEKSKFDRDLFCSTKIFNENEVDRYYKENSVAEVFWREKQCRRAQ